MSARPNGPLARGQGHADVGLQKKKLCPRLRCGNKAESTHAHTHTALLISKPLGRGASHGAECGPARGDGVEIWLKSEGDTIELNLGDAKAFQASQWRIV